MTPPILVTDLGQNAWMSLTHNALSFTTGVILGGLASWAAGVALDWVLDLETGFLAIPFGITAAAAALLMIQERFRWIGFGLFVGAIIETVFLAWLLAEWARGMKGF